MNRRTRWHAGITAAILLAANALIVQKEILLRNGTSMLLVLAPVDPRSLLQGDYMQLRYDALSMLPTRGEFDSPHRRIVVKMDADHGGTFVRVDRGEPLAAGEHFLRYYWSSRGARLGAESFFFQEGTADRYAKARYGELKVEPGGNSVLVGLCDEARHRLGTTPPAAAAPR